MPPLVYVRARWTGVSISQEIGGEVLPGYPYQVLPSPQGQPGLVAHPLLRYVHGEEQSSQDTVHRDDVVSTGGIWRGVEGAARVSCSPENVL